MMFTRIITKKNGRQYLYAEERYREDGRVRSRSRCLGPVNGGPRQPGWLRQQFPPTHGLDWDKIEREMGERMRQEQAKADAFAARMYLDYGMILKTSAVPIEKVPGAFAALPSPERPVGPDTLAQAGPDASPDEQSQLSGQPADDSSMGKAK